jgi:RNA polymerase sigma-54 factor
MQIGLKISPRQVQTLKPTLQQLQYYRLLQQTNLQLEEDIREEVSQNPALEIEETRRCPKCGEIILDGHPCTTCISRKAEDSDREQIQSEKLDMMEEIYSSYQGSYEASTYESIPDDELPDAFATVVGSIHLEDHLKSRLAIDCSDLGPEDRLLAIELIDHIDANPDSEPADVEEEKDVERTALANSKVDNPGLINATDGELAEEFGVSLEQLARVRKRVAAIDPIGSGLQSPIEVLAMQAELAEDLTEDERVALADIIRYHLKDISREQFTKVGRKVGLQAKRVKELIEYVRRRFHIHPRRRFEEQEANAAVENPYITSDVRIRDVNGKFVVEVLDSGLPQLRINKYYLESYRKLKNDRSAFTPEERKHIREYFERASTYIENLNSRRQTMLEITEEIVRKQEEYLRHGPLYLKKLTRKQVAEAIGVHPSTVSRALAVRYCWLPDNSIVSFNVFFNPAACYIEMIRQILKNESPDKVYSDEEIRDIMAERGHDLSRRVITKYRKKGKIPASGRRKRILAREWKKRKAKLAAEADEVTDEIEEEVDEEEDIDEPDDNFNGDDVVDEDNGDNDNSDDLSDSDI